MRNFWENEDWENEDWHLKELRKMAFNREFPFIPSKDGFYVIRGPRQVGKSSWLKAILSYHAKRNPKDCFYHSCEEIQDYRELSEVLKTVKDCKVILLDELTFVSQWDRAIKRFIDSGDSQILVVTGSNSTDLRKGTDRMPGRYRSGGEFELLPMSFQEFTLMRAQAGWQNSDSVKELEAYFQIGGFPIALSESGSKGKKPQKAMETYRKWLVGDFSKLKKQEIYLQEVLIQIAMTTSTPISLQKLAQRTQLGSHHTVQEYISTLEDCFALQTLYAIDPNTGAKRFRKEKKFYFRDPIIFWLVLEWAGVKAPKNAMEILAESVAAEHLFRNEKQFGYFHSKKGEIDFYKKDGWAIEVKWAPQVTKLSEAYLNSNLLNKKVWFQKNFLT